MEKYGFVYIWRDRKHNRYYIGCHWGSENDGYVCSSSWMKQAYKHRPEDFKRRIISKIYTNKKDLLEKEYEWLKLIKSNEIGKKYYNLHNCKFSHWSANGDESAIVKTISEATKEAMAKPEIREKYLKGLLTRNNRSSEPEIREKRRKSMIGKNVGKDNSKAVKASAALRAGIPLTNAHKQKIKESGVFKQLNSKLIQCVCGKFGNAGNIGRWHKNCRELLSCN